MGTLEERLLALAQKGRLAVTVSASPPFFRLTLSGGARSSMIGKDRRLPKAIEQVEKEIEKRRRLVR